MPLTLISLSLCAKSAEVTRFCLPFYIIAILEWQATHNNQLPDEASAADELERTANALLKDREVNTQVITTVPREQIE
jgi:hypothetical protein